jgi:FKBP-type peptidyl-prolyl cis-trans isomerase
MKKIIIFSIIISLVNHAFLYCGQEQSVVLLQTTEGIYYEVVREGEGLDAVNGRKVSIHYTGWVNDNGNPGSKIDSSKDRNMPVIFELGKNIIKGWDLVIKEMKVGALYRLYIPSALGYGSQGLPGLVAPNSDLIFDIELIAII